MSGDFPTWVWLIFYGGSVSSALLTLSLWFFRSLRTTLVWTLLQCSLIVIALFAVADVLNRFKPANEDSSRYLTGPAFLLIAVSAGALIMLGVLLQSRWYAHRLWWNQWGRQATYLLVYGIAVAGLGLRFYQVTESPRQWQGSLGGRGDQGLSDVSAYALTDAGRRLPLYRFDSTELAKSKLPEELSGKVVVLKRGENSRANCHGWVFTGGYYLVRSEFVDDILKDNGYAIVASPATGDLIIYRNPAGQPVHTGFVKAAGQNGFVLIESKWGPLGTFLHMPEDQVYSMTYAFYRSARDTHRLTILEDKGDQDGTTPPDLAEQNGGAATDPRFSSGRATHRDHAAS